MPDFAAMIEENYEGAVDVMESMFTVLKAVIGCPQAAPWLAQLPMDDGQNTFEAAVAVIAKAKALG